MLNFFRGYSSLHLFGLVLFFIVIRIPFFLYESPILIPELGWMLVGEQMSKGFILYKDIWDNVSPLAGAVYWGMDLLFGRSQFAYHCVALAISLFQIIYFNYIFVSRDMFPERSVIPGAIYAILLSISFDMATLSPMLLSTTFLLLALGGMVRVVAKRQATSEAFEMGIYIGTAVLFYLPSGLFFFWVIFSLLFYSIASIRNYFLVVLGTALPLFMTALVIYLNNAADSAALNIFNSLWDIKSYDLNSLYSTLTALFVPVLTGILGFMKMNTSKRFFNYQIRMQQVMALWVIFATFSIPFKQYLAPIQFINFIPALAFFATFFFINSKNWLYTELQFVLMLVVILSVQYFGLINFLPGAKPVQLETLQVKKAVLPEEIYNRKILVLGADEGEYLHNQSATPYLNWELASNYLTNLDNFDSVIHIYDSFRQDPPDYVIDKVNLMPKVFARIPELKSEYKPSQWKGIYERN